MCRRRLPHPRLPVKEVRVRNSAREGGGPGQDFRRRRIQRRKFCRFCEDPNLIIDYKEPKLLRPFITERGKILSRRMTGNCAKHQREVAVAVKRARNMALLPFVTRFS